MLDLFMALIGTGLLSNTTVFIYVDIVINKLARVSTRTTHDRDSYYVYNYMLVMLRISYSNTCIIYVYARCVDESLIMHRQNLN